MLADRLKRPARTAVRGGAAFCGHVSAVVYINQPSVFSSYRSICGQILSLSKHGRHAGRAWGGMRPAEEGEGLGLKFPLKGGKELNSAGMFIDRKKAIKRKVGTERNSLHERFLC